jgi:hypothetical protein
VRDAGASSTVASEVAGTYRTNLTYGSVSQTIIHGVTTDGFSGSYSVQGDRSILTDQYGTITLSFVLKGSMLTVGFVDDTVSGTDRTLDEVVWTSHPWKKTS